MKAINQKPFPALLLAVLSFQSPSFAKDAPALLIKEGSVQTVFLTSANEKKIEFKSNERAIDKSIALMSSFDSIYVLEPKEFSAAMELYYAQDYKGAKEAFQQVQELYKAFTEVKGNYATLAGFYEMECCRKLWDLEGLEKFREGFMSEALVNESQLKQIEIYRSFWEAVRTQAWQKIILLKEKTNLEDLTLPQRAQIYLCLGLAHEGKGEKTEALYAFNNALVADSAGSEIVAQKALIGALRVIKTIPEAQEAIKQHGTDNARPNSVGAQYLAEGAALTGLWKLSIGGGQALPSDLADFSKYKAKK